VFRVKSRELGGGHAVLPEKTRGRYVKALTNIPCLLALSDVFRLVDNTDKPEVIFVKGNGKTEIFSNRFWPEETVKKLTSTAGN
jgi:predicted ABC-type ATPase